MIVLGNGKCVGLKLAGSRNGNKIVKLSFDSGRGFSIQTNQNLPLTHRMTNDTIDEMVAIKEIQEHLKSFGTLRQRDMTGLSRFTV